MIKKVALVALACGSILACGGKDDDGDDKGVSGGVEESPLGAAFPAKLALDLGMTGDSGTSLALQDQTQEKTKPLSAKEKESLFDEIFEAENKAECFRLINLKLPQPDCFSPNMQKADVENDSNYVVSWTSAADQALYGDTGMVTASETLKGEDENDACAASTIRYFTEEALNYVDRGRFVFAALTCAAYFSDTELPKTGDGKKDYMSILDFALPSGYSFKEASIAAEDNGDGGTIYETRLRLETPTGVLFTLFRHDEANGDGHVVVLESGNDDDLSQQNQLKEDAITAAVSVTYNINDDKSTDGSLYRGAFKQGHPGNFIKNDGSFDFTKIADELGTGNEGADNFFYTVFQTNENTSGVVSKGIVDWTASLSDGFWRAFSYSMEREDDVDTLKSTFGFAELENGGYLVGQAPVGMFCAWAQQSPEGSGDGSNLLGGGLQGDSMDLVQYQTASREKGEKFFTPNASASGLGYTVGHNACGTGDNNTLKEVDSNGNISGTFNVPSVSAPSAIGGITIKEADVPL